MHTSSTGAGQPGPASTPPSADPRGSLAALPGPRRLALGLFLLSVFGFYGLAQTKLVTTVARGGLPGPADVLVRYHGDPSRTRLHRVLDPTRAADDPQRMYPYLGASEAECEARRAEVLAWATAGAPREGWAAVAPVFTGDLTCGMCHSKRPTDEGKPRTRADLPFDTYEQVVAAAQLDTGMALGDLLTSAHNHAFGFAVLSLLVAWIFTATAWRGPIVPLLVSGAFVGALLDVACWFLTKFVGAPFQYGVMLGGGLFAASVACMALLSFDELALRGRLARVLSPVTAALRLGRSGPAAR